MGKKMYKKTDVSKTKTEQLGISSLLVLDDESDSSSFSAVHKRYFKKKNAPVLLVNRKRQEHQRWLHAN